MFQWINEKYDSPLSVSSDVTIGEGKTVITFWGTGKSIETGEMEEINRDCVLEYELDAEVLHLEETPELVENVWDPKEKGQQGQAETIYDPEAGVTATLRDISNVGANLIIRREDDDDGAEVIYGEAYILQRQESGRMQRRCRIIMAFQWWAIMSPVVRKPRSTIIGSGSTEHWNRENIEWSGMSQEKTAVRQAHRHTGSIYVFDFREGKS